jgi:hypothetical protein
MIKFYFAKTVVCLSVLAVAGRADAQPKQTRTSCDDLKLSDAMQFEGCRKTETTREQIKS